MLRSSTGNRSNAALQRATGHFGVARRGLRLVPCSTQYGHPSIPAPLAQGTVLRLRGGPVTHPNPALLAGAPAYSSEAFAQSYTPGLQIHTPRLRIRTPCSGTLACGPPAAVDAWRMVLDVRRTGFLASAPHFISVGRRGYAIDDYTFFSFAGGHICRMPACVRLPIRWPLCALASAAVLRR